MIHKKLTYDKLVSCFSQYSILIRTYNSNINVYVGYKHNFILIESNNIIFLFINIILKNLEFSYLETILLPYLSLISFELNHAQRHITLS